MMESLARRRSSRASRVIKHSASPNEGYNRLIRDRLGCLLLILELVLACVQHHCRLCGRLFCNNCCDNYLEVTVLDPLFAVRVCNKCYQDVRDTLRRRATAAANPASVWCILVLSLPLSRCAFTLMIVVVVVGRAPAICTAKATSIRLTSTLWPHR